MQRSLRLLAIGALMASALVVVVETGTPSADAAVVPRLGYRATVDGFTSWYGSYDMGALGAGWCIDHGIPAPDPALDYVATQPAVSPTIRTAAAWLVGRHGATTNRITAAAMMLALHDLMGAVYPSGRLDLARLAPSRLAGFEGSEAAVLARARALHAEALARSELRAPFRVALAADPVAVGATGTLRVRVTDADGRSVPTASVLVASTQARLAAGYGETGGDGMVRIDFEVDALPISFEVHAVVPDLDLATYAPSRGRAQRVVVPGQVVLAAVLDVDLPPGRVSIHKTGDATPQLPVAGARFALRLPGATNSIAEWTIGDDGSSPFVDVDPGAYDVVESTPPPGYLPAPPQRIEVRSGHELIVEVHDLAAPASLTIVKQDGVTRLPLAGAVLDVVRGAPDGPDSEVVATIETRTEPTTVDGLRFGRYWLVERSAPPGYAISADPVRVELPPGQHIRVAFDNAPRASLAFVKVPRGAVPADASLAGAVFAVDRVRPDGDLVEVARCTTDADGRCALPDGALAAASPHCWREVVAPTGFELAAGQCLETGAAGTTLEVTVDEPSAFVHITATKLDSDDQAVPIDGATYRLDWAPDAEGPMTEVARVTSGHGGALDFGLHPPGHACLAEIEAPVGYLLDRTPVCFDIGAVLVLHVDLLDERLPPERPAVTTTSTTVPPVPAVAASTPHRVESLPRTGATTVPLTLVGAGVVFLGAALTIGFDQVGPDGRVRPVRRRSRRRSRRSRARSSVGGWRTRPSTPPRPGDHR